jgi:hypothetical protein
VKIFEWLGTAVALVVLWISLVAILCGFASTINATDTKQKRDRTGKMACLWALALTAIYAVERWLL